VVPFVVVVFSPLTFGLSLWWAYALQLLPLEFALFGALYAHAGYLRRAGSGRWWQAAGSVPFVVFGLAFAEKAALLPAVLFGVTLALAAGDARARVVGTVRGHARLWLGYLVLLAGYVAVHAWRAPVPEGSDPTVGAVLSLVRSMIGDGLLPAMFGGPWSADWVGLRGLAPPATAVLAVTWTLSAVVVLVGLWLGRARAAFAWLTLGGYVAASVLLVAVARLAPWGALVGTDPRYIADSVPLAAVCAALAVLRPLLGAQVLDQPDGEPAAAATRRWRVPAPAPVLPLVVAAALVVGAGASIVGALPELRHGAARDYVETATAAHRLEPNLVLYDAPVPPDVMLPFFGDWGVASRALHGLDIRFDRPAEDLRMLDGTGTPRRIGLVATVGNATPPAPGCGFPVGAQATRVPLVQRAEGERLVVQLGYFTQNATDGTVATPTREFRVRFQAGLHLVSVVADGPFAELLVSADGPVCVTNALVGLPLPHPS